MPSRKRSVARAAKAASRATDRRVADAAAAVAAAREPPKKTGRINGMGSTRTADAYANFALSVGLGTDNALSAGRYVFNNIITRLPRELEFMYRGSWIPQVAVDTIADDMTRAGVEVKGQLKPDSIEAIEERATTIALWTEINRAIKWGRLYGGAIAFIDIDGQDPTTPLRIETVGKDGFKGLIVYDRWMVTPSLNDLVTESGPSRGLPKFYDVVADAPALPRQRMHHSRCIRFIGVELPWYQRLAENLWGVSVIEPLYDRLVSFDAATMGASQLVHKSFLRTLSIEGLREALSEGGDSVDGLMATIAFMRRYQANENISVIDAKDKFTVDQSGGFAGVSDILLQLGQQLSGALQVPLVRLFGQSPAGLSATGESDLRNYYDGILQRQNTELLVSVTRLYRMIASSLSLDVGNGFKVKFRPLWQMTESEKSDVAEKVGRTVGAAFADGIVDKPTAMRELRQSSEVTGVFSNVTDESIKEAELAPPPTPEGFGEPPAPESGAPVPPRAASPSARRPGPRIGAPGAPENDASPRRRPRIGEALETFAADTPAMRIASFVREKQPREVGSSIIRRFVGDAAYPQVFGRDVVIENPVGSIRRGFNAATGKDWRAEMAADYGYIRGTSSAEGPDEQMDVFVGPDRDAEYAYVLYQRDVDGPNAGKFDEHKVLACFGSPGAAIDAYSRSFSDDRARERIMKVERMDRDAFDAFLENWKYGTLPATVGAAAVNGEARGS